MKISEVIQNITEIQDPDWATNLNGDELESIRNNFWLVWMKMKKIKDMEIIQPLAKISEFLSEKIIINGRLKISFKDMEFKHFYLLCIEEIPKKKYSYIFPKKKKSETPEDYEFVKLLAKDLKESTRSCEDYYNTLEELGILEKERKRLYSQYGIVYQPISNNKIEVVKINSINPNTAYPSIWSHDDYKLLKDIENYGMLEPILADKKTNVIINGKRRYRCIKELGWNSVQVIKRTIHSDISYNKKPATRTAINMLDEYVHLRNEILKLGYKERRKVMGKMNMREYIYKETGISQSQFYKLKYIFDSDQTLFNDIDGGKKTINDVYSELKLKNK